MRAGRYRKKPVVIDAVQFDGSPAACTVVTEFLGGPHDSGHRWKTTTTDGGFIVTLEGEMEFVPGDWIIRGVKGEFYPCKPDIFDASYEPDGATKCERDGHVFENNTRFCMVCHQDFSGTVEHKSADGEA